jgi:16S rRNA G966 N2-methylase RsmD
LIEENLDKLDIPETSTNVLLSEAESFAGREHIAGWDIAFFDPPYESDYSIVLDEFGFNATLLHGGGILVVEHHSKKHLADEVGKVRRWRILKQGETSLSFYENA